MANDPVVVHGLDELGDGTLRLADKIAAATTDAANDVGEQVADGVRMRVPRRSGRLAGSVSVGVDVARHLVEIGIGDGVDYAGWIEFGGTRGRPYVAQGRYLYPTADEGASVLEDVATSAANEEIRGFSWPNPK